MFSIHAHADSHLTQMASYEMNEVMRRLTLATIIFLPLTLLTGYFGMNFDAMWSVHGGHSDIMYAIIPLPPCGLCMHVLICVPFADSGLLPSR